MKMSEYNVGDTFKSWEYLDAYFRQMPTGIVLNVRRKVDDGPGVEHIYSGMYIKLEKGYFSLHSGQIMFVVADGQPFGATDPATKTTPNGGQTVYPDEMVQSAHFDDLEIRVVSLDGSKW